MKVLIFAQHPKGTDGGGINRYCSLLSKLFKSDNDIDVIYSTLLPVLKNAWLGAEFNISEVLDEINRITPDIIHLNGYTTQIIRQVSKIARKRGIKLVYTAHWHPFETMNRAILKRLYFYNFVRPYLKEMDAIVTINNEDTAFFTRYSDKVFQIPHWMYVDRNINITNINKVKNRLLFIGRTSDKNKGFSYLTYLPKDKFDVQIVGEYIETGRDDFHFNTNISEERLVELYKSSSLLLIPSRYEAFSYVALEALSFGTQILISDKVRIADYLPDNSYGVFKYGDINSFLQNVNRADNLLPPSDEVLDMFQPKLAYEKYRSMYLSVISAG